jgi:hypothetical protein
MAKRAKGLNYASRKGKASTNDNTRPLTKRRAGVRVLSSQDATATGRPGFKAISPGVVDGKDGGTKILMRNDPSVGITQPGAKFITTAKVDLVGEQNPKILSQRGAELQPTKAGRRVIRPAVASKPVKNTGNKPGRLTRTRNQITKR